MYSTRFKSRLFRGHTHGSMKFVMACCRNMAVNFARYDGVLYLLKHEMIAVLLTNYSVKTSLHYLGTFVDREKISCKL